MNPATPSHLANPHDRFFRHFLADPRRAQAFLRHVLPADVQRHLDLATLRPEDASFVDPDLRRHQGDLLFRVDLKAGGEGYVYLLFEHKSYPDRWVAWQVLRYMVRIWEREWRERQGEEGARLSPIVPVVVYHGRAPWRAPQAFEALVAGPAAVRAYVPAFAYRLYDLSEVEDEVLWGEVVIGAWLALLKYIQRPELEGRLEAIFRALARWMEVAGAESGVEALVTVLRYLAEAREGLREEVLRAAVERALPGGGAVMATLAQKWLEQGLQEGLQKGLEEGLQKGLQQGLREGLVKARREDVVALLEARLAPEAEWLARVRERLEAIDDLERLQRLLIAAAQAESLDAFEAALAAQDT